MAYKAPKVDVTKEAKDKVNVEIWKMLLSSISGRACNQAYLNIAPGRIIISNATTDNKSEDGDRIINYNVGTLCFHVVTIKNPEVNNRLFELLQLPKYFYYTLNIGKFVRTIKSHQLHNLVSTLCTTGEVAMGIRRQTEFFDNHIIATPVMGYHLAQELVQYMDMIEKIGSEEHRNTTPHILKPMKIPDIVMGKVYFTELKTNEFKHPDGSLVFPDCIDTVRIPGWDGISSVAYAEFVKKMEKKFPKYVWNMYAWTVDDRCILTMSVFENELVHVKTIRPNILTIPIKKIDLESNNILAMEDNEDESDDSGSTE